MCGGVCGPRGMAHGSWSNDCRLVAVSALQTTDGMMCFVARRLTDGPRALGQRHRGAPDACDRQSCGRPSRQPRSPRSTMIEMRGRLRLHSGLSKRSDARGRRGVGSVREVLRDPQALADGSLVPSERTKGSTRARSTARAAQHLSVSERAALGKAARAKVPRSSHAAFEPAAGRADPQRPQRVDRAPRGIRPTSADRSREARDERSPGSHELEVRMHKAVPAPPGTSARR